MDDYLRVSFLRVYIYIFVVTYSFWIATRNVSLERTSTTTCMHATLISLKPSQNLNEMLTIRTHVRKLYASYSRETMRCLCVLAAIQKLYVTMTVLPFYTIGFLEWPSVEMSSILNSFFFFNFPKKRFQKEH